MQRSCTHTTAAAAARDNGESTLLLARGILAYVLRVCFCGVEWAKSEAEWGERGGGDGKRERGNRLMPATSAGGKVCSAWLKKFREAAIWKGYSTGAGKKRQTQLVPRGG